MQLTSTAFVHDGAIPAIYTSKGDGVNPPLDIGGVPPTAKSLALIMHDPDAPGHDFSHWILWNILPDTHSIQPSSVPHSAQQGTNDFGKQGYGAPSPPSGTHRYVFELYALDTALALPTGATRTQLIAVMQGRMLAMTTLVGTVSA